MVKLTDWESGHDVWIRSLKDIRSMRRLPAVVCADAWRRSPTELGERTRIDTDEDTILVRETPEEIMAMFASH